MPNNLPARIPVRAETETTPATASSASAVVPAETCTPIPRPTPEPPPAFTAFTGLVLDRRALAFALRFASRVASRAPIQALKSCLFADGYLVATDLDVSLRVRIPSTGNLGVLVAADALKRCVIGSEKPDVEIRHVAPTDARPFAVSVNGAILAGHDPRDFPSLMALFPLGEPVARAKFGTLEPVLVAATTDETRKAMCAVFFQLCKNLAVATNGHVLHTLEIDSENRGDFLVPRKAVELVENIRKATKAGGVEVRFFEHQAVFRVGRFEVASRLETEKFPAWEEVLPKESKYELQLSKSSLLEALDQIGAAIGERSRGIRVRRVAEGLEIHGENADAGTMTTVIEASGWEEGQMIGVNLGYLYNATRFTPSDELRIGITDENTALLIEDGPYFACVMPMGLGKRGDESEQDRQPN